jgi:hypothetical protein
MIDTTYTVIYSVTGNLMPHTHTVLTEEEAIRFAAGNQTSRIRRDMDNAYYDKASGQWLRIAGSPITSCCTR